MRTIEKLAQRRAGLPAAVRNRAERLPAPAPARSTLQGCSFIPCSRQPQRAILLSPLKGETEAPRSEHPGPANACRPLLRRASAAHSPGRSPGAAVARPGSARGARSAPRTGSRSRSRRSGRSAAGPQPSPWRRSARPPAGFRRSTSGAPPAGRGLAAARVGSKFPSAEENEDAAAENGVRRTEMLPGRGAVGGLGCERMVFSCRLTASPCTGRGRVSPLYR